MLIENSCDKEIVEEVLAKLNIKYECHKYYNDGVTSRVILLNNTYLIKQNTNLEAEVEFFKYNKFDNFQKIIYAHPDLKYVVYDFLEGQVMYDVDDSQDAIQKIIEITSNYATYPKEGYGYYLERVDTWNEFLKDEIESSSKNIKEYIKDFNLVNKCLQTLKKYPFTKKIIHGDFGTHNFIKKDNKMIGVIDPDTVIGDPLYDTLFAIVSNVDILQTITFNDLCKLIKEDNEKIYSMLVIVLYSRISRCLKFHKEDIDIYMNYWCNLEKINKKVNETL